MNVFLKVFMFMILLMFVIVLMIVFFCFVFGVLKSLKNRFEDCVVCFLLLAVRTYAREIIGSNFFCVVGEIFGVIV